MWADLEAQREPVSKHETEEIGIDRGICEPGKSRLSENDKLVLCW